MFVVLIACATAYVPHPSRDHPLPMCAISCKDGRPPQFAKQHLCFGGGSRFFADFLAIGEHVERNEDGTLKINDWIGLDGDHAKADVETCNCAAYIHQVIQARATEQRGQFPGETEDGRSAPPQ